ncbi:MAG: spore protease YyaC [Clostridia bacterium]|nr:spore protease YyaC [Clostridia bacterium]
MQYSFNLYNKLAPTGALMALNALLANDPLPPVVVCIGSDLVIGDALGPITGTMIQNKTKGIPCYVYGSLNTPVTAKEIKYINTFLRRTHPDRKVIAIDAAVGEQGDIGLIKISDCALRPGSGANKKLGKVGDVSVLGIIAEKSLFNYSVLNSTRLSVIYTMSQIIADAVASLLWNKSGAQSLPSDRSN